MDLAHTEANGRARILPRGAAIYVWYRPRFSPTTNATMMLRAGASLGVGFAGLTLAERVPVAFHEAGHAVVASHVGESGICASNGCTGRLPGCTPMLRYATITPRQTEKGQTYLGETKLTLRWRDMPKHVLWDQTRNDRSGEGPLLASSSEGRDDDPAALLGLARIAYLFGGRAAEERLRKAFVPWSASSAADPSDERVRRLMERPGNAHGDLRKAKQIALEAVLPRAELAHAQEALASSERRAKADKLADPDSAPAVNLEAEAMAEAVRRRITPPFEAAYAFADDILRLRWADVCVLSGALLVRGTIDGAQFDALASAHQRALGVSDDARHQEAGASGTLLQLAAPFPFVFGCVFALGASWPAHDARFALPGEPWPQGSCPQ